jgi:adenylate kinase
VCRDAGHSCHVDDNPPKRHDVCDYDGSPLIQRDDDSSQVVGRRLAVYREQTAPLDSYYLERSLLINVDGSASPAAVYEGIHAALSGLGRPNADAKV